MKVRRPVLTAALAVGAIAGGNLALAGPAWAPPPPPPGNPLVGYACGYWSYTGMWGPPSSRDGCGQPNNGEEISKSPEVTLPTTGSGQTVLSASRAGAVSELGPAVWMSGPWPIDENAPRVPTGQLTASTNGTVVVQATARVNSIGPGPFITGPYGSTTGWVKAECTATTPTNFTRGVTITDGKVITDLVPETGEPRTIVDVPVNPGPNTRIDYLINDNALPNGGDTGYIIFNEQITAADGYTRTTNAVHMFMTGPNAFGDLVIGSVKCGHP